MPRLPDIHHNTTASARAFHVKRNNAAIAPTWNTAIKSVVTQLIGWANVLSRSKMFVTSAILKYAAAGYVRLTLSANRSDQALVLRLDRPSRGQRHSRGATKIKTLLPSARSSGTHWALL